MATTGTLVEWLAAGVTQTSGTTLASGKVRFYQPGTLTPQSVFSDSACTSAISQPITLSAGGTSIVYANASVRMIAKDATDTSTLFDVVENVQRDDNTFVTSPAFNGGTETTLATILDAWATSGAGGTNTPWTYKQSGSATERTLNAWLAEVHISVKDFGAVGNGIATDTTSIQNAVNAMSAAGGGIVYFPPGTYLINAAITVPDKVQIIGSGIVSTTVTNSNGSVNCFSFSSVTGGAYVQDLSISHQTSSTGKAISFVSCNNANVCRTAITGYRNAVYYSSSYGCIDQCVLSSGAATSDKVVLSDGTSTHVHVRTTVITATGSGTCVEFGGSGGQCGVVQCTFAAGATGINIAAGTQYRVLGNYGLSSLTTPFNSSTDADFYQAGNGIDGYAVNVAIGGSHTPSLLLGPTVRIVASSGGAGTVSVNIPAPAIVGSRRNNRLTIKHVNASGGAVTWSHDAQFIHVGAAEPASTDLHTITVEYLWDPDRGKWREICRGDTLT